MRLDHYKHIRFERDGVILRVIIDHGEMNLVDGALHDELSHVFYDMAADEESEVVILQSAGRVFSAGGDIGYMEDLHARPGRFSSTVREARRVVFNLLDCDSPSSAASRATRSGSAPPWRFCATSSSRSRRRGSPTPTSASA